MFIFSFFSFCGLGGGGGRAVHGFDWEDKIPSPLNKFLPAMTWRQKLTDASMRDRMKDSYIFPSGCPHTQMPPSYNCSKSQEEASLEARRKGALKQVYLEQAIAVRRREGCQADVWQLFHEKEG